MSRADWVEMTTTNIAGTLGDGAITMTAITGLPSFTMAFGAGNRLVEYDIEDTVSGKMETGLGYVASNVLTRTQPRATFDGSSTYSQSSPSALQFGSTPTTGNVRIRMACQADSFMPVPPAINKTVGASSSLGYQISGHLSGYGNEGSGAVLGNTLETYMPYYNLISGKVDGFGLRIAVVGTTGIKAGLFEVGVDGLPGQCVTQFNAISNTATGWVADTTSGTWAVNAGPLRVNPGWFYLGFMCNDNACQLSAFSNQGYQRIAYPPLGRDSAGYGFGEAITKTAQNSYATGLPTGIPTGTYTMRSSGGLGYDFSAGLKVNN